MTTYNNKNPAWPIMSIQTLLQPGRQKEFTFTLPISVPSNVMTNKKAAELNINELSKFKIVSHQMLQNYIANFAKQYTKISGSEGTKRDGIEESVNSSSLIRGTGIDESVDVSSLKETTGIEESVDTSFLKETTGIDESVDTLSLKGTNGIEESVDVLSLKGTNGIEESVDVLSLIGANGIEESVDASSLKLDESVDASSLKGATCIEVFVDASLPKGMLNKIEDASIDEGKVVDVTPCIIDEDKLTDTDLKQALLKIKHLEIDDISENEASEYSQDEENNLEVFDQNQYEYHFLNPAISLQNNYDLFLQHYCKLSNESKKVDLDLKKLCFEMFILDVKSQHCMIDHWNDYLAKFSKKIISKVVIQQQGEYLLYCAHQNKYELPKKTTITPETFQYNKGLKQNIYKTMDVYQKKKYDYMARNLHNNINKVVYHLATMVQD